MRYGSVLPHARSIPFLAALAFASACSSEAAPDPVIPAKAPGTTGEEQRVVSPSAHLFAGIFVPGSAAAMDPTAYEKLSPKGIVRQTYRSFAATEDAVRDDLSALWSKGATPQLYIEPTVAQAKKEGGTYTRRANAAETEAGTTKIVSAVTGWLAEDPARRLYLTFAAEANGGWTPYGCWYAEASDPAVVAPDGFVDNWRRFHGKLRAALLGKGLDTRRVRWVYGPDRQGGGRRQRDTGTSLVAEAESGKCPPTNEIVRRDYKEPYRSYWEKNARWQKLPGAAYYWPGAAYVDYVGMSAYRTWEREEQFHWADADALVRSSKELLAAVGLPEDTWAGRAIILQTGSPDPVAAGKVGGARDAWIRNAWQAAADDPAHAVTGIIYFSLDKKETGARNYANDWSVSPASGLPALLEVLGKYGQKSAVDTTFERFYWDVPVNHPYYPDIQLVGQKAWDDSKGTSPGGCGKEPARFCPDRITTRTEVAAMIERVFGKAAVIAPGEAVTLEKLGAALSSVLGSTPLPKAPTIAGLEPTRGEAASYIARAYRASGGDAAPEGPSPTDSLPREQPPPESDAVDPPHEDDPPAPEGEGEKVAESGVPGAWTCAPELFGDATCDCACGAADFDCDVGQCP